MCGYDPELMCGYDLELMCGYDLELLLQLADLPLLVVRPLGGPERLALQVGVLPADVLILKKLHNYVKRTS